MVLTRDKLEADWVRRMIAAQDPDMRLLPDEVLDASLAATLAAWDGGQPVWVFGYGSLIWNPCVSVAARTKARLFGYHRELCLWTPLGRGSRDNPGLVFGLERGGSCHGVALAVAAEHVQDDLRLMWRREMLSGAYEPRWVNLKTETGPLRAIAFVMNCAHDRYAGQLDEATKVRAVATATGALGSCYDYVASTLDHLAELGLRDPHLEHIRRLAAASRD
ncbi:MAG: gamma-glutamylcyclotransferase [Geminicoccaceae bacterium]|nr:MAG: gamma-glutamylcyclotransferase [Geminicoccaceae bacterium]